MSAFIVDTETINKVVSYLYAKANGPDRSIYPELAVGFDLSDPFHIEKLANQMFDMNVAAVQARYGEAEGEGFPLPAFNYVSTPATQIEVIKALECWKYQCTEGDIPQSEFYKAMEQTRCLLCSEYIHQTEEYEAAPWG